METLDWGLLKNKIVDNKLKIAYEDNKHMFTKVAFDVFRFNNPHVDSLWILEQDDSGKQYLVARYDEKQDSGFDVVGNWTTVCDKDSSSVILAYKNFPIYKFSSNEYSFNSENIIVFQKTVMNKISTDPGFCKKILGSLSEEKKNILLNKFPELL